MKYLSVADDKPLESPYYPLKVGNTWTYKLNDTHFTMKVAKFEDIDKQSCARLEMLSGDNVKAVEHIAVTSEGVKRFQFDGKKADPPVLFLKTQPKAGETWEVNSKIGTEKLTGTFKIGEEAKVAVGGKTYENVITSSSDNLDANGLKISFTYYFAKDVGMIKQVITVNGVKVEIELEKFEAAKDPGK
jgi:hypothetical protein